MQEFEGKILASCCTITFNQYEAFLQEMVFDNNLQCVVRYLQCSHVHTNNQNSSLRNENTKGTFEQMCICAQKVVSVICNVHCVLLSKNQKIP